MRTKQQQFTAAAAATAIYTSGGGTPVPPCQMAWIEPEPSSSTQPRRVHPECRAGLGHGHYAGGARRLVRSRKHREPFAQPPSVFLGAAEAQALADTDHTALRELLAPDYGGVSISFAELLFRVVRRCKRDWQVRCRCKQKLPCVRTYNTSYVRTRKVPDCCLYVCTYTHVYTNVLCRIHQSILVRVCTYHTCLFVGPYILTLKHNMIMINAQYFLSTYMKGGGGGGGLVQAPFTSWSDTYR